MNNTNKRRAEQLGMSYGKACSILKKTILFTLLRIYNLNYCFHCKEEILNIKDLSIEHKISWLDNRPELFWDLNNIAFSHLSCNCSKANKEAMKKYIKHGSSRYNVHGCRCKICKEYKRKQNAKRIRK
jgi:hypothetical protein